MYYSWKRIKHLCIFIVLIILLTRQTQYLFQLSQQEQPADINVSDMLSKLLMDANSMVFTNENNNETTEHLRVDEEEDDDEQEPLFGACLQVMDENHRLPEWLAYHYYMLPLRHLVLYVDPRSETSPMDIVNRWRPFLTIDVWNMSFIESQIKASTVLSDKQKRYPPILKQPHKVSRSTALTAKHRYIQPRFNVVCSMYLRQKLGLQRQLQHTKHSNSSVVPPVWVALHDVDEYVYLDPGVVEGAKDRMSKPGSIRTFIQELAQQQKQQEQGQQPTNQTTIGTPGQSRKKKRRRDKGINKAAKLRAFANYSFHTRCIRIARNYYGAIETSKNQTTNSPRDKIPEFINVSDFETLRFRHRTSHQSTHINGPGKSMALFGHYPGFSSKENLKFLLDVHQIFGACADDDVHNFSPIRIRHFLGSWEVYTSRVDARIGISRSREHFLFRSEIGKNLPPDISVEPWMQGFCRHFHFNQSLIQHLLQGAGKLPPPSEEIRQINWSLPPGYIHNKMQLKDKFSRWLQKRYEIVQLNNDTSEGKKKQLIVKVKNPNGTEPYPYTFPPLD